MKTMHILTIVALSALSGAFAQNLSFDTALARAGEVASVQLALQEQRDALENLRRVKADPLATRLELLQAQHRADLADTRASRAPLAARAQVAGAYLNVLAARASVPLSQKSVQVSEQALNIAQIRAKNGSGTQQAVRDAQNQLDDARQNLASAQANLTLATQALRDLIGGFESLADPQELPAMPGATVVDELLSRSPNLLQARQNVQLTEAQLGAMHPSYTPRKEIEAVQSQLETARKHLTTAQQNERQLLRSLFDTAVQDSRELAVLKQSAASATQKLTNDRRRLEGGVISPFELLQSELSAQQADVQAQQGRNDYLKSYYNLRAGQAGGQ